MTSSQLRGHVRPKGAAGGADGATHQGDWPAAAGTGRVHEEALDHDHKVSSKALDESMKKRLTMITRWAIGWSNENGHNAADQVYFYKSNAKFLVAKNHRNLNKEKFLFWKFANTFLLIQRSIGKKKILIKKIVNIMVPKMSKLVMAWSKEKCFFF